MSLLQRQPPVFFSDEFAEPKPFTHPSHTQRWLPLSIHSPRGSPTQVA